ncbi:MAG: hypothetical protein IKB37_04485 [Rikenellaceae bacterium]|nr:hypothetical protein [Rikenellaceae bacterium]
MRTKFGLAALFAAVLGFVGCSNVDEQGGTNNDTPAPAEYQLTINATAHEPATRVVISGDKTNGFETSWEVGDLLGVFTDTETADASDRSVRTYNYRLEATTVNSDGTAVFSASLYKGTYAGVNDLYAYYPYKSALATANDYASTTTFEDVKCQIPAEQAMTESGSYDPTAAYMVAHPSTIDLSESKAVETTMTFRHLNCFVNLSTKSVTADGVSGDEVVNSIAMTVAGKTLAGDFELNLADGSTNFTSTSETITVAVPDGTTLADLSAWLVVNPFSLESGDELELVITTNKNIITKTITGKTINFAIKNVITLNLAIDNTCTVEPFTASNLFADGTYVIADDTNKKLMIPGTESDYRGYANYTIIPTTVSAEQAWILTSVGSPGENLYTIQSAESNKYLSYNNSSTATKNNYAQLNDEYYSDKSDMLITATEDGKGYQIKWNTNQQRILGYNSSSPRFAFYLGTQQNVLTLVPVEVTTTISVTSDNAITTNPAATDGTISYSLIYGEDGAKVSATSSASWLTVGEITSTSVAYSIAANTDAERTATITLSYEGAEDVTISVTQKTQSLTITSATDVNVAAEANSTLSVAYTLVAADDDAAITAESSAAWLTIGNITSTSVAYSVSENTSTEERTATITLAYGTLTQEVTVNQSGVGGATEYTVTYTVANKTSVTKTGTAPTGSSATFNNTYTGSIHQQMTGGNSTTLTLSGYDGAKITGITMSMKSNSSKGAGSYTMKVGTKTISSITDSKFNTSNWAGKWSTSYIPITPAVTATTVGSGENIEVIITASANSLYIEKYTITYEM